MVREGRGRGEEVTSVGQCQCPKGRVVLGIPRVSGTLGQQGSLYHDGPLLPLPSPFLPFRFLPPHSMPPNGALALTRPGCFGVRTCVSRGPYLSTMSSPLPPPSLPF